MTNRDWVTLYGALGFVALLPVIWAIVDVSRRPPWQFSTGRKILWAATLGFGWLIVWPIALLSSLLYLAVLRRKFPPATAPNPGPGQSPYGFGGHLGGGYSPYGTPPYGARPYGGHGGPPSGRAQTGAYGDQQGGPAYGNYGYPPSAPSGPPPPLPPAGWYPDPAGSPQERWWDGRGWSDHLRGVSG